MVSWILITLVELVVLSMVFAAVAVFFHGLRRLRPSEQLVRDWRINLAFMATDAAIVVPVAAIVVSFVGSQLAASGATGLLAPLLSSIPFWLQLPLALLVIDFIGYWRHRLMHLGRLWPIHSVHHSDKTVTWLTLVRFHPLNRMISVLFYSVGMAVIGFSGSAIMAAVLCVHFYGYYLHADVPWKYGILRYVFVSPTMHRWHHSYAEDAKNKNYAVLFAFYDVGFGTFFFPDRPIELIGVGDESYPQTWLGQMIHPFRVWLATPESLPADSPPSRQA